MRSKIKNIVLVNDFDYVQGGASKVAIQTANLLAESLTNVNVYFFSSVHGDDCALNKKVISICLNQKESLKDSNKIRGAINGLYNFKAKRELKKLLKTLDRDNTIIHVHGWTKALSSSIYSAIFKMKFKSVLTMHDYFTACPNGGYFNYKKNEICHIKPLSCKCCKCNCDSRNYGFKLYRVVRQFIQNKIIKLNSKLTDVISISDFSENILKKTLSSKTRIHRVYNPIDLDTKPKMVDYKKNKYYLYVGRLSPEKGADTFCKVISELGLKGIVVGDGSELVKLKKQYPSIEFAGWKAASDVKKYMQGAKALIIPSKWYEGAPLTPLESMQYGIPLISSDCNAAKDYVTEKNGFIYNSYDDLKEKLMNFDNYNFDVTLPNVLGNYEKNIIDCYNEIIKY